MAPRTDALRTQQGREVIRVSRSVERIWGDRLASLLAAQPECSFMCAFRPITPMIGNGWNSPNETCIETQGSCETWAPLQKAQLLAQNGFQNAQLLRRQCETAVARCRLKYAAIRSKKPGRRVTLRAQSFGWCQIKLLVLQVSLCKT